MKAKYIVFVLPFLLLVSCDDFLSVKPLGNAMESDINVGKLESEAAGLYACFRGGNTDDNDYMGGMVGLPLAFLSGIRSDDADKGYEESNTAVYKTYGDQYQYSADDTWLVQEFWNDHYSFIIKCNKLVYDADSLKLTDDASLINIAEARFFRAYAYFDLVRAFGDVPLNLGITSSFASGGYIPKSTVDKIYTQIDEDLKYAGNHLPLKEYWEETYPGRLAKGAAKTLWAKTKLYRQNWAGALSDCEEVISSGEYALYPTYKEMFEESGELCSESILEVQNYVNDNGSVVVFGPFPERTGIRGHDFTDQGWGWNTPSDSLVRAYEPGDSRLDGTVLFRGGQDGYGNTIPQDLTLSYWNRKTYGDPARAKKVGFRKAGWMNVRILRYADVLLMAAEAANELGDASSINKALGYLEQVRNRARNGKNVLPEVVTTNQAELRNAIKHERRVEFGMEFERFYDLVRWGDALKVLGPRGYTDRCRYYPIPNSVIIQTNGVITQNPEWN